ncbi:MAG TPA: glucose-1-phosphate cytidylyltransferase [Gemmatimonadaceae bacterium]|nr:glucose-1-phosphate cytidylyltransferase [Gemmatimonadaceae bacterium]
MKTVILAGGLGTRLAEDTAVRPKPMVEIGDRPMLWHIMALYAAHGFNEFVVACGYKGEVIKQYFADFSHHNADWSIDLATGERTVTHQRATDWKVHLVDTGADTLTGGRLLQLRNVLGNETFMVTYGDGLSNVNVKALVAFHKSHGKLATVTAVHPPARFGEIEISGEQVSRFSEKTQTRVGWINGGFFVFEPGVLDLIEGPESSLEKDALERLASDGNLMAFKHEGFWQPMDTLREKLALQELWQSGNPPWMKS